MIKKINQNQRLKEQTEILSFMEHIGRQGTVTTQVNLASVYAFDFKPIIIFYINTL